MQNNLGEKLAISNYTQLMTTHKLTATFEQTFRDGLGVENAII